jgi:hypothetical protein
LKAVHRQLTFLGSQSNDLRGLLRVKSGGSLTSDCR